MQTGLRPGGLRMPPSEGGSHWKHFEPRRKGAGFMLWEEDSAALWRTDSPGTGEEEVRTVQTRTRDPGERQQETGHVFRCGVYSEAGANKTDAVGVGVE